MNLCYLKQLCLRYFLLAVIENQYSPVIGLFCLWFVLGVSANGINTKVFIHFNHYAKDSTTDWILSMSVIKPKWSVCLSSTTTAETQKCSHYFASLDQFFAIGYFYNLCFNFSRINLYLCLTWHQVNLYELMMIQREVLSKH